MGNIKEINNKNRTYYFFDDLKIDKKSCKNIYIYYIGYITMKDSDYVKIKSVNPLYFIINKVDGHFEEKNGNKYSILEFTDKNKEVLRKYTQLWNRIKNSIEKVINELGEIWKIFYEDQIQF